jgi:glutamine amidotransferase
VCVGLQLLFESSEEGGGVECLGVLRGTVKRFPDAPGLKIPQIGWNSVRLRRQHALVEGIPEGAFFYFVHSYYVEPADPDVTLAVSDHGIDFTAMVASDSIVATQFHPEKSADLGLRLYANFGRMAARHQQDSRAALPAHPVR